MINALLRLFRREKSTCDPAAGKPKPILEGTKLCFAFSNPKRSWTEDFDLLEVLKHVLHENDHKVQHVRNGRLLTGGYLLYPELISFTPLDDGEGSRSCTIIHLHNPDVGCDDCFEWQHSIAHTLEEACRLGFDKWCKSDLVALLDSTRQKPESCTYIEVPSPNSKIGKRYVLGPAEVTANPPSELELINAPDNEGHSFCPCCMTTACMQLLAPQVKDTKFAGIRYFVMRDQDGVYSADFRINGLDFEPGKEALIEYAKKWPGRGLQYRKQYVVANNYVIGDRSEA